MDSESRRLLVARARGGDRRAFDELIAHESNSLRAFVDRALGTSLRREVDPDDVMQESLLRAYQTIERFEWKGPRSLGAWLRVITAHVIHEAARRKGRRLIIPLHEDIRSPDPRQSQILRRQERFVRLERALQNLSPDHRRVIRLARIERRPMSEVAQELNRSPRAVTQLLIRAVRALRRSFGTTDSLHLPDRPLDSLEGDPE